MANLTPTSNLLITPPLFDQGLGRAKKAVTFDREKYHLGVLGCETNLFNVPTIGASVANTTVQAYAVLPGRVKIPKIVVFCSAISTIAGTISFNLVLGTGAYIQGNVPGNDNSDVPPVSYNANGDPTGSGVVYPAGGGGLCSNPALPGQAMFAADVAFNATNFPNTSVNGVLIQPAITTANGTGANYGFDFAPTSPDAVWPNGGVLTLRVTTPAGASISNLIISAYMEPQPLSATWPSQTSGVYGVPPEPTVDF